jgi:hypothetical protein
MSQLFAPSDRNMRTYIDRLARLVQYPCMASVFAQPTQAFWTRLRCARRPQIRILHSRWRWKRASANVQRRACTRPRPQHRAARRQSWR